jgi:hypothetical protein
MPFTPKFVDLVRNLTAITGTGPVTLGSAVNGFTSLAAAVSVGEQFYYCIQGLDMPSEREVGRGPMQANGTVARQPISGTLTNFTTGAKTIAMVAAAEWFARLEGVANGGGVGGVLFDVATRTALAARTPRSGGVQLTEAGREGLFTFDAANLAARVAADPRQGVCVAPASDPTGASGAWVRTVDGACNVRWFGAVGDGVTDDLPAFTAALAYLKSRAPTHNGALFKATAKLYVPTPARHYYLSSTLNVHQTVHIFGDGSGAPNTQGTMLRFGDNCSGIVLNDYRTLGEGLGSVGDASGSIVEGLFLNGGNFGYNSATGAFVGGDGTSTSGHGIRIRATGCTVRDIAGQFWAGDLVNINATSGAGGASEGNANNWTVRNIWGMYNDGSALGVYGSDANAGTSENVNGIQNRIACINDRSFLGNNTHITPHARDNGVVCSTGLNSPTGVCSHGGANYAVVQGQEAAASTTVPGTNGQVWHQCVATTPFAKPWVTGMTWVAGGPYLTSHTNANGCSVFVSAYAEAAQGPVQAYSPTRFIGGLLAEVGFTSYVGSGGQGAALWDRAAAGDLVTKRFKAENGAVLGGGTDWIKYDVNAGGSVWKKDVDLASGRVRMVHGGADYFAWDTSGVMSAFRLRIMRVNNGVSGVGHELGFVNAASEINARAVLAGDYYFNRAPVVGGNEGWIVTTGGTVGSGAVLTPTGIVGGVQAASQADTAAADLAALKGDFNALLAKLRAARLMAA